MAPSHEGPHKKEHGGAPHRSEGRAFNTPQNAINSVATGRACIASLIPGKIWSHRAPRGEFEIKGSLTLGDAIVVVLRFSPEDGSVLPKGLHGLSAARSEIISPVESRLKQLPKELVVLDGAEFREPESCWAVPVAHKGRIVGHIKISSDGSTVLPDKKATEELAGDGGLPAHDDKRT